MMGNDKRIRWKTRKQMTEYLAGDKRWQLTTISRNLENMKTDKFFHIGIMCQSLTSFRRLVGIHTDKQTNWILLNNISDKHHKNVIWHKNKETCTHMKRTGRLNIQILYLLSSFHHSPHNQCQLLKVALDLYQPVDQTAKNLIPLLIYHYNLMIISIEYLTGIKWLLLRIKLIVCKYE